MIERFHKNDSGYRRWRKGRGDAFVFNHFRGSDPGMNVLHRADCEQLVPQRADHQWTSVEKLCSTSRAEVEAAADELRGGRLGWITCSRCLR